MDAQLDHAGPAYRASRHAKNQQFGRALELYRAASEGASTSKDRARWTAAEANVHLRLGRFDEAETGTRRALEMVSAGSGRALRYNVQLARVMVATRRFEDAERLLHEIGEHPAMPEHVRFDIEYTKAGLLAEMGEFAGARELLRVLTHPFESNRVRRRRRLAALIALGDAAIAARDYAEASACAERAFELTRTGSRRRLRWRVEVLQASVELSCASWSAAQRSLERARKACPPDLTADRILIALQLSQCRRSTHDPDTQGIRRAIELSRTVPECQGMRFSCEMELGLVLLEMGQAERTYLPHARSAFGRARRIAQESGDRRQQGQAWAQLAIAEFQLGRLNCATASLAEAGGFAKAAGSSALLELAGIETVYAGLELATASDIETLDSVEARYCRARAVVERHGGSWYDLARIDLNRALVAEARAELVDTGKSAQLLRAVDLAVPALLAKDSVRYTIDSANSRVRWREDSRSGLADALRLAVKAGDSELLADLVTSAQAAIVAPPRDPDEDPGAPWIFEEADGLGDDRSAVLLLGAAAGLRLRPGPWFVHPDGEFALRSHLEKAASRYQLDLADMRSDWGVVVRG